MRRRNFTNVLLLLLASSTLLLTSCNKKSQIAELQGTWDIVEVQGTPIESATSYLSFVTNRGVVEGFLGCNNISGTFDIHDDAGELDLENLTLTYATCEKQAEELAILAALEEVDEFRIKGEYAELLSDDNKHVLLKLKKTSSENEPPAQVEANNSQSQINALPQSDLNGRWEVASVLGITVAEEEGLLQVPYLEFALDKGEVIGNTSCNTFLAKVEFDDPGDDDYDATEIDFDFKERTTVACDHMALNDAVVKAIDEADNFGVLQDGSLVLLDDDAVIMTLVKK